MSGWASRRPNRPKSRISDSLTGPARETQGSFHAIALRTPFLLGGYREARRLMLEVAAAYDQLASKAEKERATRGRLGAVGWLCRLARFHHLHDLALVGHLSQGVPATGDVFEPAFDFRIGSFACGCLGGERMQAEPVALGRHLRPPMLQCLYGGMHEARVVFRRAVKRRPVDSTDAPACSRNQALQFEANQEAAFHASRVVTCARALLPKHRIQQALRWNPKCATRVGCIDRNPAKIFRRDECGWKAASIAGLGS